MRILIADDHSLFRDGLRSLLGSQGHEVVAEARKGREAIALAQAKQPDLVLMDVTLPDIDGLTMVRLFRANPSTADTPIMVRAMGSRAPLGGLPSLRPGSTAKLANGFGAGAGGAAPSGVGGMAAAVSGALLAGGSTLKLVPHFGQRILSPFSGTRRSST